jgi:hypothetical protein
MKIEIRWQGPGAPSQDVVALRRAIYVEEAQLLQEKDLVDQDDRLARHLCVYVDEGAGPRLAAAMQELPAETGSFGRHTGLPADVLKQGYTGSRAVVANEYRNQGFFSLMLYLAMRDYRMQGRKYMFGYMEPGDQPAYKILRYRPIEGVASREIRGPNGHRYEVVATWQDLAYGLHRAFESLPENLKTWLQTEGVLATEIVTTVQQRIQRFYDNPWFARLQDGSLTREHYVAVLANMHQFVRWTTRLLGRIVGVTADSPLRRHYIEHLEGEIDHDVLLEHDLAYLGADVEYVKNYMVPLVSIQEFMVTQESMAAFHQDPLLFLAVPFSVEGLSGFLPKETLTRLCEAMASWGVDNPKRALSFLASHVHTDGGEDGHWEKGRQMVVKYVTTEAQVQRFLNVVHLVMNSLERAYTAYASIPALTPNVRTAAEKRPLSSAA